ncbi:MAG: serine/threonine protein kinase [Planctomycetes bacterium]|nr:serine/threonine protein kinase [Planctomycetota bacterium]
MADADALIGKEIGHCKIQRKLGQGGMGAVYLAHHPGLNRSVAIKILPGDLASDPEFKERFFREARLAARLEHPNVVQVHDVGEEQGVHYISMQYVEGKSLDGILKEKKKLTLNEALAITKRVAVALSAAAKLGIVHRDIKPHNILVSKDGVVKVADFGLAKDEDSNRSISEPGTIMGTPYYMSPEQAKGEKVDPRGDIYSLGATLYHMLTGRRLFDGGTPVSIVMKQISEEPVPLREVDPSISEAVGAIVGRMLMKDPATRYQTADELVRALDGLKQPGAAPAKEIVVEAPPPKRRAAMVALPIAGILVVGIIVGLVVGRGSETRKDPPPVPLVGKIEPKPTPEKPPVKPEPETKPPEPPPMKPAERILSKLKDGVEKKFTEEALARAEEFLQAMQKKDTKAIRGMLDELAYGQLTDAQVLEVIGKAHSDKGTLESWEIMDVEIRMKLPGARPQPHATLTMTYDVKLPKGELKITDQPLHMIRRIDGKWYVTRLPKTK